MDSRLHPCIPGNLELGTSNKLAVFAATKFEEVPCRRSGAPTRADVKTSRSPVSQDLSRMSHVLRLAQAKPRHSGQKFDLQHIV